MSNAKVKDAMEESPDMATILTDHEQVQAALNAFRKDLDELKDQVAMRSGSSAQKHQLTTAQVQETAGLDQAPRQLVSNSGPESTTLGWRIAATVNEMESAELEDFVVNLSKSTCRALQKAIGARLEAPPQVQELPSCFRLFDPQDNGFVPRETVAEIMQHGGNHFSEEMLEETSFFFLK
eukprot:g949.t1